MRFGLLVLGVAAALGLGACGGDDPAPLALQERLPTPVELPGYAPSPDGPDNFDDPSTFAKAIEDGLVQASVKEASDVFDDAGFISAIGQEFSRAGVKDSGLYAVVILFESEEGAQDASDWRDKDIRKPCPRRCSVAISEFDVEGIPGATTGVRRTITAERLEATQEEGQPYDSYEVGFLDGRIAYDIQTFGPPGSVTEDAVIEALKRLYERVNNAPLPNE